MDILVLGNGFDLEHDLPTKYADFIKFTQEFEEKYEASENYEVCNRYIENLFYKGKPKSKAELLNDLISENSWITYFQNAYKDNLKNKINWIDFESEISTLIQALDQLIKYKNDTQNGKTKNETYEKNLVEIIKPLIPEIDQKAKFQDIEKLEYDLKKLIVALEIHIDDYVENLSIKFYNPSIANIYTKHVLSFNYSNTYEKIYEQNKGDMEYCHIHGKVRKINEFIKDYKIQKKSLEEKLKKYETCKAQNEGFETILAKRKDYADQKEYLKTKLNKYIEENNMILGIDEYLSDERANKEVEFIPFKKYYQRIYKKTGNEYKNWIAEINRNNDKKEKNTIYIFGHSLDVTDGDVLRELINHEDMQTVIFYRDKTQLGIQIANLVKVLHSDRVIEYVYGAEPKIKFIQQKERQKIKNSSFEITTDITKWANSYKITDEEMKTIIKKLSYNIEKENLKYFCSQERVITLFDVLQKQGLSKYYLKKLMEIAKKLTYKNETGKLIQFEAETWGYQAYDGYFECDRDTRKFIDIINEYNKVEYCPQSKKLQNQTF